MIFELIFGLVDILISAIPSVDFVGELDLQVAAIQDIVNIVAIFLPVKAIASCLFVILALDNARFVMSILNFIIRKIPGVS